MATTIDLDHIGMKNRSLVSPHKVPLGKTDRSDFTSEGSIRHGLDRRRIWKRPPGQAGNRQAALDAARGKVKAHESLDRALRREIREELGSKMRSSTLLDIYDRREKGALSVLFRVSLEPGRFEPRSAEIAQVTFRQKLPSNSTPTAEYFWDRAHRNAG